jgi:hypothetical protein
MRFKDTAGLFAAAVLAIGALNIGCDSEKSEKAGGEHGAASTTTEGGRPDDAPVTGTGGSTAGVGTGVGTGGGTGAGAGRTSFDGTVDATSGSAESKSGATTAPSKGAEPSGEGAKSSESK